jgi:hypothetical protein
MGPTLPFHSPIPFRLKHCDILSSIIAAGVKIKAFRDMTPCSFVESLENGGRTFRRKVVFLSARPKITLQTYLFKQFNQNLFFAKKNRHF